MTAPGTILIAKMLVPETETPVTAGTTNEAALRTLSDKQKLAINIVTARDHADSFAMLAAGKADAFLGFAQQPEELRLKHVGHVIVDTAQDRPWSQYFCCMVAANRDFAQRHPIATKHALRPILKSADLCAADPQSAARFPTVVGCAGWKCV